jgi:hypothetical protein
MTFLREFRALVALPLYNAQPLLLKMPNGRASRAGKDSRNRWEPLHEKNRELFSAGLGIDLAAITLAELPHPFHNGWFAAAGGRLTAFSIIFGSAKLLLKWNSKRPRRRREKRQNSKPSANYELTEIITTDHCCITSVSRLAERRAGPGQVQRRNG